MLDTRLKNPWAKLAVALAAVGGLVSFAALQMFPGLSVAQALLYGLGAFGALALLGLLLAMVHLVVGQAVLRWGGTDVSWFWFSSEPRGLAQQRAQLRAQQAEATAHRAGAAQH
jgi:hypothetical protein